MCAQRLKYKHGKAYRFIFNLTQYALKCIFTILYRANIKGLDKIPRKGKYLICSNHISYIDPVLIGAYLPRFTYFMAKEELFTFSFISNLVTFFNTFPVNRGIINRATFNTALNLLKNENILCLFPEGTRSVDGKIGKGKKGVGLISFLSGAPIIPMVIVGSNKIIQKPHKRIFFPKIKMAIGDIIDTARIIKENNRKDAIQIIVDETMRSLKKLYQDINQNK